MTQREDPSLSFVSANAEDANAMRRLAREAYGKYVERIGREPAPMTADYEAIAVSGAALLVWRDDTLCGMLVTSIDDDALVIDNIAVSPEVQGTGLGTMLLGRAERIAEQLERDEIRLYTNEAMGENLAFYRHHGYVETRRAVDDGFRRVFFAKRLGQVDTVGPAGP